MPNYRIAYKLPDGSLAGYHGDSFCSITQKPERAKVSRASQRENAEEWLKIVRRNFSGMWEAGEENSGFSDEYKTSPIWKGHGPSDIRIELEEFA